MSGQKRDGIDLDAISVAAAEWWGEGNGVAEAASIIAKVPLIIAAVAERDRVLGAVAALVEEYERTVPQRALYTTERTLHDRLRAVLAPVSGAVEGAGVVRLAADPARVVPCPHDCGWVGPLDDFHGHRAECPVRANLPSSPVAGHEQEVRAEDAPTAAGDKWCHSCGHALDGHDAGLGGTGCYLTFCSCTTARSSGSSS